MAERVRVVLRVALVCLIPILVLEGSLRLAGWPTDRVRTVSKLMNWDAESFEAAIGMFRPGARTRVSWPPELAYRVHVNALGLRGPEISRTPPPGRRRILTLGDSMTFGYYLEEDETWPAQLEALLRANGIDAEVVNGGCGGWSIDSEALFLEERGLSLEPDLVLLGFFANDIRDLERGRPYYGGVASRPPGLFTRLAYQTASYELMLRLRVFWKRFRQGLAGEVPHPLGDSEPDPERTEELWQRYAEWLERLKRTLDARGIPLLVVYIPDAWKLEHGLPARDEARLRDLLAVSGVAFASAQAEFEHHRGEGLFHLPLDAHLTPAGARRVADAAAEALLANRADFALQ